MTKLKEIPGGGEIIDIADPFDLDKLRLNQNFVETAGVKTLLTTVPARRPNRQAFVRVHPDQAYRGSFAGIELKEDRELFVVTGDIQEAIKEEIVPITIFTAITKQGTVFLWPIKQQRPDGKVQEWWRSEAEAAEIAMQQWVRVQANMGLGAYQISVAEGTHADPVWPEASFKDLLKIAFRGRLVDRIDHPVLQRLRGIT